MMVNVIASAKEGPLILHGEALTVREVAEVANGREVKLDGACAQRLESARVRVMEAANTGERVYGLTTGVGALRGVAVERGMARVFNRRMILSHRVGYGRPVPATVVRATMLCRAQGLSLGGAGVRPQLIEALLDVLNSSDLPAVKEMGSVGQGDLAPLAEIAEFLITRGLELEEREALALIGANSFAIGWSALALERMKLAIQAIEVATALTIEALLCNVSAIDPAVYRANPASELKQSILSLRRLLSGGALLEGREQPRLLQDPLSIRVAPQTHATAWQAWGHAVEVVERELASAADNPLLTEDGRFLSVGNFDSSGLASVLDYARIGLAHALTISCERVQKLLASMHSGLNTGLRERAELAEDALAIFGHGVAALTAEARLLAQPVSLELPTSSIAEGIEDRVTMAATGARRLDEQTELALRIAAIEMVCAAQALDLRKRQASLGKGTAHAYLFVRKSIPFTSANEVPNIDLDEWSVQLEMELRAGAFLE